jgi:hypothetical protein
MKSDSFTAVEGRELEYLHTRLAAHFEELRARRAGAPTPAPIFALEHGLSEAELLLLRTHVCAAVRRGRLSRQTWLPFVVYAAELGYEYSGDEYWQTFEARTPAWAAHGDRQYIRRNFIKFKEAFSGAEPSGPWAVHFSIICWPITHAVLPTDLQRQLARLLFEYRRILTADLLHDPDELGRRLAARAWQASSRFQNFAQNTELLGRVASALLVGEEEDSPYLLSSTLRRIVGDLEQEREARRWLRGARSTASHVRTRGFRPHPGRSDAGGSRRSEALAPSTDPEFWLRHENGRWVAYVDFPDLSVIGERFPEVRDELNRLRAQIAGVARSPIASGRLLYGRQRFPLKEWPPPDAPLVQLEGGSPETNRLLSDQCVLARPGPWLFRLREPGRAVEVRGGFVRPGHEYILLSPSPLSPPLPAWMGEAETATAGVHAYSIQTPAVLDADDLSALRGIGVSSVTEVEIRPAGLVPALWDGEGTAEWFVGETPMLAISTTRDVAHAVFTVDSNPQLIPWDADGGPIFVSADALDVGVHRISVSLTGADTDEHVSEGAFDVLIRAPAARPAGGSLREGLMILPTPVSPSLEELWDGKAVLEVLGPPEADVAVEVALLDRSRRELARQHATTALPVDQPKWLALFSSRFRDSAQFQQVYDDAEACEVVVRHPSLGQVSLRAERLFAPLRWSGGTDRKGRFARLIDNTEGAPTGVEFYDFTTPDRPALPDVGPDDVVRVPSGGLLLARASDFSAAVILPREVRSPADLDLSPRLQRRSRSVRELLELLSAARSWATASLTANPIAEWGRYRVESAITAELCAVIGGRHWAAIERDLAQPEAELDLARLQAAVGQQPYQARLAGDLAVHLRRWGSDTPEDRADAFAGHLARRAPWLLRAANTDNRAMAEFLLRLASQPGSLARRPTEEVGAKLAHTLKYPVLLRAARFVVLVVEREPLRDTETSVSGRWTWR